MKDFYRITLTKTENESLWAGNILLKGQVSRAYVKHHGTRARTEKRGETRAQGNARRTTDGEKQGQGIMG